jgi:acyl dehydratase
MPFDHSLVDQPSAPSVHSYTWRDAALYALGIGARKDELDYLYEGKGPKVYPSFGVVPGFSSMFELLSKSGGDLAMLVHGSQRVRVHQQFKPADTLSTVTKIRGIYDMRKFAVMYLDSETKSADGAVVCESTASMFFRGEGGFGGTTVPKEAKIVEVPRGEGAREPDFRVEETTSPELALLYRLSGDVNPLHADPEFATSVGFPRGPILHGLCTYGHMVRHAAKAALGGDASRLTGFDASFKKPVWPGDTLITEGWNVGDGKIALQMKVKERDEVVLGGWATYR